MLGLGIQLVIVSLLTLITAHFLSPIADSILADGGIPFIDQFHGTINVLTTIINWLAPLGVITGMSIYCTNRDVVILRSSSVDVIPISAPLPTRNISLDTDDLPSEAIKWINKIRQCVTAYGSDNDRSTLTEDGYAMNHMLTDYVPETVRTFRRIPTGTVRQPYETELIAQLQILEKAAQSLLVRKAKERAEELKANKLFIEERFGVEDGVSEIGG